jgi:ABC-type multidrug transport system fused ATPase/permease subunit
MLPFALSSLASGMISLNRMSKFLSAEELDEPYLLDPASKDAVNVDGDFSWEVAKNPKAEDQKKDEKKDTTKTQPPKKGKSAKDSANATLPSNSNDLDEKEEKEPEEPEEPPYELKDLKFSVPKGAFVGVVGRIGSGKVSNRAL